MNLLLKRLNFLRKCQQQIMIYAFMLFEL